MQVMYPDSAVDAGTTASSDWNGQPAQQAASRGTLAEDNPGPRHASPEYDPAMTSAPAGAISRNGTAQLHGDPAADESMVHTGAIPVIQMGGPAGAANGRTPMSDELSD